jgi:hypothetical protein
MSGTWAALAVALAAVVPVVVLSIWSRVLFTRRFDTFRCRIGPPRSRWRRARWRLGWRRATWVSDVLLIRSGPLGSSVTPLATGVPRSAAVHPVEAGAVRGLGPRPVMLRMVGFDGAELEIAVPEASAVQVLGPFLVAGLPELPPGPRERGC